MYIYIYVYGYMYICVSPFYFLLFISFSRFKRTSSMELQNRSEISCFVTLPQLHCLPSCA